MTDAVWLVVVNLAGVHGPIRCSKRAGITSGWWDKTGNWGDTRKPISRVTDGYSQKVFTDKATAAIYRAGAGAVLRQLRQFAGKGGGQWQ